MPELPDVEGFGWHAAEAAGKRIASVETHDGWALRAVKKRALRALRGRVIEGLDRHGKHLFLKFDRGPLLAMHFGMSGRLAFEKDEGDPPAYSRLVLHFEDGTRLVYVNQRLGLISLAEDADGFRLEHGLGPDALKITELEFLAVLKRRRGCVKAALMDQSFMAGIGNEYSDEVLFQARLDPSAKCRRIPERRLRSLYETMRRVLKDSVQAGGERRLLPDSFLTKRRGRGADCPRCGRKLEASPLAGRTSYHCARCQRFPSPGRRVSRRSFRASRRRRAVARPGASSHGASTHPLVG